LNRAVVSALRADVSVLRDVDKGLHVTVRLLRSVVSVLRENVEEKRDAREGLRE